jgi:ribose 5-phosphate isomerase A
MVPNGAVLGLGTGTTAEIMLEELAERVRQGLSVTGVATSERTKALARSLSIPMTDLNNVRDLTMSIDGADEVTLPDLGLIKGHGGALLREKLVASSSRYRIIIVDSSKLVMTLTSHHTVPVEVVPFGWRHTVARLEALGAQVTLRMTGTDPAETTVRPFTTDGGHYILDCRFMPATETVRMAERIKCLTGVIEHGLFLNMTERVIVGDPEQVKVYDRP